MPADVEDEQRGEHADDKHAAPADVVEEQTEDDRREEISRGIPFLQHPGEEAAFLRRERLHRERRAESPFASHRNAVERAQHEKDGEVRRERGCEFDDRIECDVDHERRAAAVTIRNPAEDECPKRAAHERQRDRKRNLGDRAVKIRRDAHDDERDEKEVERIERPPEETRDEGLVQGVLAGVGDVEGDVLGEGEAPGEAGALDAGNSSP